MTMGEDYRGMSGTTASRQSLKKNRTRRPDPASYEDNYHPKRRTERHSQLDNRQIKNEPTDLIKHQQHQAATTATLPVLPVVNGTPLTPIVPISTEGNVANSLPTNVIPTQFVLQDLNTSGLNLTPYLGTNWPPTLSMVKDEPQGTSRSTAAPKTRNNNSTQSKKDEREFQEKFVKIVDTMYTRQDGTVNYPLSSDGIPYSKDQLMELAKTFRNRLRRIKQSLGDTDRRFLNVLEKVSHCQSIADMQKLREELRGDKELDSCWVYDPTQDRRTQVPRWYQPNSQPCHPLNPQNDSDLCKKVYLNVELLNLFGRFIENRPNDEINVHSTLKESMIYRKYCTECPERAGCYNILHLGIATQEQDFINQLQQELKPPDQYIQEFRDWTKLTYKHFAMSRNSSPDDFLQLASEENCPLLKSLAIMDISPEPSMPNDHETSRLCKDDCCYLKFDMRDARDKEKNAKNQKTIVAIREGVLRFVIKDRNVKGGIPHYKISSKSGNEQVKPWYKCDEWNKDRYFNRCINPAHAQHTVNVLLETQPETHERPMRDLLVKLPKKLLKFLASSFSSTENHQKVMSPIEKFGEITYYRFLHHQELRQSPARQEPSPQEAFDCFYYNKRDNCTVEEPVLKPWKDNGSTPLCRIKVKPLGSEQHFGTNRVYKQMGKQGNSPVNNNATFNLCHKNPVDDHIKCQLMFEKLNEGAHARCQNKDRCMVSYTNNPNGLRGLTRNQYKFNVCLDRFEVGNDNHKNVSISVENEDNQYMYISLTSFDAFQLGISAIQSGMECVEQTYFKRLKKGKRVEVLRYDEDIRTKIEESMESSRVSRRVTDYWDMVYLLFDWNKDPTKKPLEPLLKFELLNESEVSRESMRRINIPDHVDIVKLNENCHLKRTEFLDIRSAHIGRFIKSVSRKNVPKKVPGSDSVGVSCTTTTLND